MAIKTMVRSLGGDIEFGVKAYESQRPVSDYYSGKKYGICVHHQAWLSHFNCKIALIVKATLL